MATVARSLLGKVGPMARRATLDGQIKQQSHCQELDSAIRPYSADQVSLSAIGSGYGDCTIQDAIGC